MATRSDITPELCRQLLRYEPETGKLFWRDRGIDYFIDERSCKIWNTRYAGVEAFTANSGGYRVGRIFDMMFRAHRVGWTIINGRWPETGFDIDHINGDPSDNRLSNLRAVPHAVNNRNNRRPTNNSSGHIGVSWSKPARKWQAFINLDGKRQWLGLFHAKEDAISARNAAEASLGFHPNHGR